MSTFFYKDINMIFNFSDKTSKWYYFCISLVVLIILGFLFTGFESISLASTSGGIAKIGDEVVSIREYQSVYNQRVKFFQQLTGGKNLTNKQVEQFGIKDQVIDSLVSQKVMVSLAKEIGLNASKDQISKTIKDQEVFHTNEKFDLQRYKNILSSNGLTPTSYEKSIREGIMVERFNKLFDGFPTSDKAIEKITSYRNQGYKIDFVEMNSSALTKYIQVKQSEVDSFINDSANKTKLEELYNRNISEYKKSEERKARHILISINKDMKEADALAKINEIKAKVNTGNFSELAKQYTNDPSGKTNGGDLGWFGKGRMVPQFESQVFSMQPGDISNPVKTNFGYHIILLDDIKAAKTTPLEEVKDKLAKDYLQNNMPQKLDAVVIKAQEELKNAFASGQIDSVAKNYDLVVNKDQNLNLLERKINQSNLTFEEYKNLKESSTNLIKKGDLSYLVKINGPLSDLADKDKNVNTDKNYAIELRKTLIEKMKEKYGVNINRRVL